jgi:hypothetical protein
MWNASLGFGLKTVTNEPLEMEVDTEIDHKHAATLWTEYY